MERIKEELLDEKGSFRRLIDNGKITVKLNMSCMWKGFAGIIRPTIVALSSTPFWVLISLALRCEVKRAWGIWAYGKYVVE